MAPSQVLIVCGEVSGELHAAALASALRSLNPQLRIVAVGGQRLAQAGAEIFFDIKALAVMGLFDVLKHLPLFFSLKKRILQKMKVSRPDAIILVDFSGFNLRFAKAINNSIPVIYYISPQVWASRSGRVEVIKKFVSKMIVLFEFEKEFYKKFGIEAACVGHPLLDIVKPSCAKKDFLTQYTLAPGKPIIALLPGSRTSEIARILPAMLGAAKLIKETFRDAQFVIAKVAGIDAVLYNQIMESVGMKVALVEGKPYDCLNVADFALVCSGTATIETTIMGTPFCVVYKMELLNYLLYRPQVKVPYIGMVNIVAQKKVIPEFIQFKATPRAIATEAISILKDQSRLAEMKKELARVKSLLGTPGAALRAARIIADALQ